MLKVRKIPWVEKRPWLASVATHYSLNVLTRQTGQKETSFLKRLPAKHKGRLVGLLQAVIPPKGLMILLRGVVSLPHLSKPILGMRLLWWNPPGESPKLELIGVGDSFRWTIRIFFLKRGVKSFTPSL